MKKIRKVLRPVPDDSEISRLNLDDSELRALVKNIIKIDPRSRTMTQALRNAAVSYYKELVREQAQS